MDKYVFKRAQSISKCLRGKPKDNKIKDWFVCRLDF
jgi:hypothetical protein